MQNWIYLIYESTISNDNKMDAAILAAPEISEENRLRDAIYLKSEGDITGFDENGGVILLAPEDETIYKFVKWNCSDDEKELPIAVIKTLSNYEQFNFNEKEQIIPKYWINNIQLT